MSDDVKVILARTFKALLVILLNTFTVAVLFGAFFAIEFIFDKLFVKADLLVFGSSISLQSIISFSQFAIFIVFAFNTAWSAITVLRGSDEKRSKQ
jgi:hypothetical protein